MRWGVLFFVLSLLFVQSELAAIGALVRDPGRALTGLDWYYYWCSLLAVNLGLIAVISIPIGGIISAATADAIEAMKMRAPWGKTQQLRRRILAAIKEARDLEQEARENSHEALMLAANTLIKPGQVDRYVEATLDWMRSNPSDVENPDLLRAHLEELRQLGGSMRGDHEKAWSAFERSRQAENRARRNIRRGKKYLRQLDRIIANGGTEERVELYRRYLAEASRR